MKKVTVGAIAVLFLLVGFGYASAQQNNLNTNMAGELTSLNLQVTYEEELLPTTTLPEEGQALVTVTSSIGALLGANQQKLHGYKRLYDPILYMWVDGNGNLSQINMTWLNPNPNTNLGKLWTISCTGGNQSATTHLPEIEDGTISNKPRETKTATARADAVHGVLACYICPDGFPYSGTNPPTIIANSTYSNLTCNGGESYINGYLTFTGTFHHNLVPTDVITSASITGTLAGGSFDYLGETWAARDCTNSTIECKAIFTGTFAATLTPCTDTTNLYCWTGL